MAECLCRTLIDREGNPYISSHGCEIHGQAPRCSDMSSREFARLVNRSVMTVCRWAKSGHPAARYCVYRKEYRWLPEVYKKTLEKSTVRPAQPVKKQRGRKPRFAAINGGQR